MVEGRILSWTEDLQSEDYPVWTDWEAGQRDVFFLNRNGIVDTTFNITPYDPGNPDDYTYIMNLILDMRNEALTQVIIGDGLTGQPLLDYVVTNYKTSTTLGYNTARDTLYAVIDLKDENQLSCVYSGFTVTIDLSIDPSTDAYNKGINCEHTWPQSMGAGDEPQKSDMHHLFPCKSNVNSSRGNDPYAEILDEDTEKWYRNDTILYTIPTEFIEEYAEKYNPSDPADERFEPKEDHKGDAARAMFYFYAMYSEIADDDFWEIQKETLLNWHYYDAVNTTETTRTWKIAEYQDGLPNPFLLDSTLARRIWFEGEGEEPACQSDEVELWGECYSIENTTELDLSGTYANPNELGEIPPEIGTLINLITLRLSFCELTGEIPSEIGNLTNLIHLYLSDNQLTGEIPLEIGNLTNLTTLDLRANQLTGILPEIGNLTNLYDVYLSANQLTGILPEIGNLTNLNSLDLGDNQFTGEIPSEIGNLTNLIHLYLSDNQLTGEIPLEIGNLTNLTSLELYYNQLTGEIPPEIGNLTNLTHLWLYNNQLIGGIPIEICNQGDSTPSLYNNKLCPPYPECLSEEDIGYQDISGCAVLIITEIMRNPSAVNDSDGEWFEIFNSSDIIGDLNNMIIKDDGTDSHTITSSVTIQPGEYFVLGNNADYETNGGVNVDYEYSDISLSNGSDELILVSSTGTVIDSVAWDNGETFPDPNGASMALLDPALDNSIGSNWTASDTPYGDGDLGTPGIPNFNPEIEVSYAEGWNIVGLPMLVDNSNYQILFPEAATGSLYSYEGSYNLEMDLVPGTGYWLRLVTGGVVEFSGSSINDLTLSVNEGWNLISGLSTPVDVAILYNSGLVVTGGIYGYDGSYMNAETIDPGIGYWVRATQDGEITLSSTNLVTKTLAQINHLEGSNELDFNNGEYSAILYFGKEVADEHKDSYSLPPTFPQMAFDVRFNGDMKYIVESGDIEVLNTSDNLTISHNIVIDAGVHMNWVLSSSRGEEYIIEGTGQIILPTEETFTLERKDILPIAYTLHQNYPNPFNPVTKITYQLPEESYVAVIIYNLAGQKVTTLVNGRRSGGSHSVDWYGKNSNGESVVSGLYFFRIEAENFSKTLKMLLLK